MSEHQRVMVLPSCPDQTLRGYVGEVLEVKGHEARVRFLVKIRNEIGEAAIALRHLRYEP
jgi:hypothetical protein